MYSNRNVVIVTTRVRFRCVVYAFLCVGYMDQVLEIKLIMIINLYRLTVGSKDSDLTKVKLARTEIRLPKGFNYVVVLMLHALLCFFVT